MDSLLQLINPQVVLAAAAIVILILSLRLLFRIVSVGLGPILGIIAVVLIVQYCFGISPNQLWFQISHLPQDVVRWVNSFGYFN